MIFFPRSTLKSLERLVETHQSLEFKRETLCYHRTHLIVMRTSDELPCVFKEGLDEGDKPMLPTQTLVTHLSPGGKDRETRKGCPKGVREK